MQRTGIKERRIASDDEFTSDLCYKAVKNLMKQFDQSIDDVDMIIVCKLTPDYKTPSVASCLQAKLGIKNIGAMEVFKIVIVEIIKMRFSSNSPFGNLHPITDRPYKKSIQRM